MFGVDEPKKQQDQERTALTFRDAGRLPVAFWAVVAVAFVLTLARFSEAFLILRSQSVGLPIALVPLIMVVMNIVYALAAYPAGVMADRTGRQGVLIAGIAFLIVADIILAMGSTVLPIMLGWSSGGSTWGSRKDFLQRLWPIRLPLT